MTLYSDCLDLSDASDSIGTKHKSDDLGNEVIVFSALLWISKISAISARRITTLHATVPDLTPRSPLIVMTPGTTSFQVRTTRATVKTAICHHGYIRSNSLHRIHPPMHNDLISGAGINRLFDHYIALMLSDAVSQWCDRHFFLLPDQKPFRINGWVRVSGRCRLARPFPTRFEFRIVTVNYKEHALFFRKKIH